MSDALSIVAAAMLEAGPDATPVQMQAALVRMVMGRDQIIAIMSRDISSGYVRAKPASVPALDLDTQEPV